jgi:hypothetical protein
MGRRVPRSTSVPVKFSTGAGAGFASTGAGRRRLGRRGLGHREGESVVDLHLGGFARQLRRLERQVVGRHQRRLLKAEPGGGLGLEDRGSLDLALVVQIHEQHHPDVLGDLADGLLGIADLGLPDELGRLAQLIGVDGAAAVLARDAGLAGASRRGLAVLFAALFRGPGGVGGNERGDNPQRERASVRAHGLGSRLAEPVVQVTPPRLSVTTTMSRRRCSP